MKKSLLVLFLLSTVSAYCLAGSNCATTLDYMRPSLKSSELKNEPDLSSPIIRGVEEAGGLSGLLAVKQQQLQAYIRSKNSTRPGSHEYDLMDDAVRLKEAEIQAIQCNMGQSGNQKGYNSQQLNSAANSAARTQALDAMMKENPGNNNEDMKKMLNAADADIQKYLKENALAVAKQRKQPPPQADFPSCISAYRSGKNGRYITISNSCNYRIYFDVCANISPRPFNYQSGWGFADPGASSNIDTGFNSNLVLKQDEVFNFWRWTWCTGDGCAVPTPNCKYM